MNIIIGWMLLVIVGLIHFNVINLSKEEVSIKLFLIVLAGLFFVRSEIEDLKNAQKRQKDIK